MKLIDITRELTGTPPYPGDPPTRLACEKDMAAGSVYNLHRIEMSLHAATHLDAPLHFIDGGTDIASMPLATFYGACLVLPSEQLETLSSCPPRLILRGAPDMTPARTKKVLALGVRLLGVERASVGEPGDERTPHEALLSAGLALLENADLSAAPDGPCTLLALPLKIAGGEAAPCRAALLYP